MFQKSIRSFFTSYLLAITFGILGLSNISCGNSATPVAKIAVLVPLDAGLVQFGTGIRNSVQLAIDEANAANAIPGWRLELDAHDDSSDPDTGAAAAEIIAADSSVIGVIGTYNSGVAAVAAPIFEDANLVMISPGNTNAALTLGDDVDNPVRPYSNYFRMVASDAEQGPFLADYAYDDLEIRNVAVVTEFKDVSQGLADSFSAEFIAKGGTILTTEIVPEGTTDYDPILARVALASPELVFYAGEYDGGAQVRIAATDNGVTVPIMGGDGIKDETYNTTAGSISNGDYASTVGAPLSALADTTFATSYDAENFAEPASDCGPYAYDATKALIAATAIQLNGKFFIDDTITSAIISSVQETDQSGVTGQVKFDEFGDTETKVLTLYQVVDGAWTALTTRTVD